MTVRKLRKCSLCDLSGHNRATCKNSLDFASQFSVAGAPLEPYKNETKLTISSSGPVAVGIHDSVRQSPHVVDLRQETEDIWSAISAYKAPEIEKPIRQVVDFAELVRLNKKESQEVQARNIVPDISLVQQIKPEPEKTYRPKSKKIINLFLIKKFIHNFSADCKNFFQILLHGQKWVYVSLVLLIAVAAPLPAFGYYKKLKETNNRLVEESTGAFLSLQASTVAALQSNIPQAEGDLQNALASFSGARSLIEKDYKIIFSLSKMLPVIGSHVSSRQHMLNAGHHLALGNTYLIKGLAEAQVEGELAATSRLDIFRKHLRSAIPQYEEALEEMHRVDEKSIPLEYQESFSEFKLLFGTLVDDMQDLFELASVLGEAFGQDQLRRYLVVFQNQNEIRPTGGFMGSFALIDVQKGKIMSIDVPGGGTYDVQGQTSCLVPPLPLQLINNRFYMHDANWFSDFPASAEKIESFYKDSRFSTVDGVIAVNASVLERLLSVVGPITTSDKDLVLNDYDAIEKLQYEVEIGFEDKNKPKAAIGDLLNQILERFTSLKEVDMLRLLVEVHEALNQKEIQIFSHDKSVQTTLSRLGWTGEIIQSLHNQDYLQVVNTNIGGGKSDFRIKQNINHQVVVKEDGSIVDTVTIRREHKGDAAEQFSGEPNIDYIRVYVPEGSTLLDAGGFSFPEEENFLVPPDNCGEDQDIKNLELTEKYHRETGVRITEEFGKTTFGHWVVTKPGEVSEVQFTYELPFRLEDTLSLPEHVDSWLDIFSGEKPSQISRYQIIVQKQSGVESEFNSKIIYPEASGWSPVWRSLDNIDFAHNGSLYSAQLKEDQIIGIIMQK